MKKTIEKLIYILLIVFICFNTIFSQYVHAYNFAYNDYTEEQKELLERVLQDFYEQLKVEVDKHLQSIYPWQAIAEPSIIEEIRIIADEVLMDFEDNIYDYVAEDTINKIGKERLIEEVQEFELKFITEYIEIFKDNYRESYTLEQAQQELRNQLGILRNKKVEERLR